MIRRVSGVHSTCIYIIYDILGKENLALDKPVKCSSIEDDSHTAAMSVDGDDETRWASDSSDPQW